MNITIREARAGDEAEIVKLVLELSKNMGEQSPITEAYVVSYLSMPGNGVLLAEAEGKTLGMLSYSVRHNLYHAAGSCLVEELIVKETERGKGVGSALLSSLLEQMQTMGCAEVSVTTMPDNAHAIEFYKSHGMTDEAVFLEKHF